MKLNLILVLFGLLCLSALASASKSPNPIQIDSPELNHNQTNSRINSDGTDSSADDATESINNNTQLQIDGWVTLVSPNLAGWSPYTGKLINFTCTGDCTEQLCNAINIYEASGTAIPLLHLNAVKYPDGINGIWSANAITMSAAIWNGSIYYGMGADNCGLGMDPPCGHFLEKYLISGWPDIALVITRPSFFRCVDDSSDAGSSHSSPRK